MSQNDSPLFEYSGIPLPDSESKPTSEKKTKAIESELLAHLSHFWGILCTNRHNNDFTSPL